MAIVTLCAMTAVLRTTKVIRRRMIHPLCMPSCVKTRTGRHRHVRLEFDILEIEAKPRSHCPCIPHVCDVRRALKTILPRSLLQCRGSAQREAQASSTLRHCCQPRRINATHTSPADQDFQHPSIQGRLPSADPNHVAPKRQYPNCSMSVRYSQVIPPESLDSVTEEARVVTFLPLGLLLFGGVSLDVLAAQLVPPLVLPTQVQRHSETQ